MNFIIRILGSNGAFPTYDRFSTAQIITVYDKHFLIDCGEGTQIQLRRFNTKFAQIENIFISHLHGDHFFGLFGLLSTYSLMKRTTPLNIFAPDPLENMLFNSGNYFDRSELPFEIKIIPHKHGHNIIFENKNLVVESFPLKHNIETWGFIFREKKRPPNVIKSKIPEYNLSIEQIKKLKNREKIQINGKFYDYSEFTKESFEPRTYAFCSDTAFMPENTELLKNFDVIYHETTFLEKDQKNAIELKHSTAKDAAKFAKLADAKLLLIGHFSNRYPIESLFLKEAKTIFANTVAVKDGMTIEIKTNHDIKISD